MMKLLSMRLQSVAAQVLDLQLHIHSNFELTRVIFCCQVKKKLRWSITMANLRKHFYLNLVIAFLK